MLLKPRNQRNYLILKIYISAYNLNLVSKFPNVTTDDRIYINIFGNRCIFKNKLEVDFIFNKIFQMFYTLLLFPPNIRNILLTIKYFKYISYIIAFSSKKSTYI